MLPVTTGKAAVRVRMGGRSSIVGAMSGLETIKFAAAIAWKKPLSSEIGTSCAGGAGDTGDGGAVAVLGR